jgi:ketopantoate reductase
MRVLIISAGDTGKVYGYHLQQACEIGFFVKETHAEELRSHPITLQPISYRDRFPKLLGHSPRQTLSNHSYDVITHLEDIPRGQWDYVFSVLPSDALRQGEWVKDLVRTLLRCQPVPVLVSVVSSVRDRDLYFLAGFPRERFIEAYTTFNAWTAPLKNERFQVVEPSPQTRIVAFRFSSLRPWSPVTLATENKELAAPLVAAFNKANMNARCHRNLNFEFTTAVILTIIMTGVQASGWSFRGLAFNFSLLGIVVGAIWEGIDIMSRVTRNPAIRLLKLFVWRLTLGFMLLILPFLGAFDFEAFCNQHFKKTEKQMRTTMAEMVEEGKTRGKSTNMKSSPVKNLEKLVALVREPGGGKGRA